MDINDYIADQVLRNKDVLLADSVSRNSLSNAKRNEVWNRIQTNVLNRFNKYRRIEQLKSAWSFKKKKVRDILRNKERRELGHGDGDKYLLEQIECLSTTEARVMQYLYRNPDIYEVNPSEASSEVKHPHLTLKDNFVNKSEEREPEPEPSASIEQEPEVKDRHSEECDANENVEESAAALLQRIANVSPFVPNPRKRRLKSPAPLLEDANGDEFNEFQESDFAGDDMFSRASRSAMAAQNRLIERQVKLFEEQRIYFEKQNLLINNLLSLVDALNAKLGSDKNCRCRPNSS